MRRPSSHAWPFPRAGETWPRLCIPLLGGAVVFKQHNVRRPVNPGLQMERENVKNAQLRQLKADPPQSGAGNAPADKRADVLHRRVAQGAMPRPLHA